MTDREIMLAGGLVLLAFAGFITVMIVVYRAILHDKKTRQKRRWPYVTLWVMAFVALCFWVWRF